MPSLILSEEINKMDVSNRRVEDYRAALGGTLCSYIKVMYLLELIRSCNRSFVSPAHAYFYARANYNEPKTNDCDQWNKYLSLYKGEIETVVATQIVNHIAELANAVLSARPNLMSAGLPKDLYDSILKCDKTFNGYKQYPIYESIELSLRHMDITESDKTVREHLFTLCEVTEMFSSVLAECIRPVSDHDDLLNRTTMNALQYTTTVLSIIFRIFSKSRNQYWYDWEVTYGDTTHRKSSAFSWVNTVPVRTPEAVLGLTGSEVFSSKSIEAPVEINGVVDRYLFTIC